MKNKLMDNIDLFIFDMDGILFDTETVYLEYGKKLLKELNYKVTNELVEKTTGLTNEEAKEIYLEEFGRDFPYDEITLKVYNYIIDEAQKGNIALMTGAKEMLEFFKNALLTGFNYYDSTASVKSQKLSRKDLELENSNYSKYIDSIIDTFNLEQIFIEI